MLVREFYHFCASVGVGGVVSVPYTVFGKSHTDNYTPPIDVLKFAWKTRVVIQSVTNFSKFFSARGTLIKWHINICWNKIGQISQIISLCLVGVGSHQFQFLKKDKSGFNPFFPYLVQGRICPQPCSIWPTTLHHMIENPVEYGPCNSWSKPRWLRVSLYDIICM